MEGITLSRGTNLRAFEAHIFLLLYLYTLTFFIKKDTVSRETDFTKLRRDFNTAYKVNIFIFVPLVLISDIVQLYWAKLFNWEPFFFLQFSIFTLLFSLRFIIIKSKTSGLHDSAAPSLADFIEKTKISGREAEVLELLLKDKKYKEISDELFISMPTVKTHISRIYKKAGVSSKDELKAILANHT